MVYILLWNSFNRCPPPPTSLNMYTLRYDLSENLKNVIQPLYIYTSITYTVCHPINSELLYIFLGALSSIFTLTMGGRQAGRHVSVH